MTVMPVNTARASENACHDGMPRRTTKIEWSMNGRFAPTAVIPAGAQKIGCNQFKTVTENVRVNSSDVGSRDVCFTPVTGHRQRVRLCLKSARSSPSTT
jgi:hypothetical protein